MPTPLKYMLFFFTIPVWLPLLVVLMMLITGGLSNILLAIV